MEGKRLDEIKTHEEYGKRPYQKLLLMLGSALLTLFVCILLYWLLKYPSNRTITMEME